MDKDHTVPLILGRLFLTTSIALVDMKTQSEDFDNSGFIRKTQSEDFDNSSSTARSNEFPPFSLCLNVFSLVVFGKFYPSTVVRQPQGQIRQVN